MSKIEEFAKFVNAVCELEQAIITLRSNDAPVPKILRSEFHRNLDIFLDMAGDLRKEGFSDTELITAIIDNFKMV